MNPFKKDKKQLSLFVTAGYPEINSLPEQLEELSKQGVDFIEVGIPFSDPLADGPTIQFSSDIAIRNGMHIELLLKQLEGVCLDIPLVIMSYFNPILHFGLENFLKACVGVGVKHLILPDVSLEIYERNYQSLFEHYDVSLCFLVAPSTPTDRVKRMAQHTQNGFVYLVSSSMTTGSAPQQNNGNAYKRIREACGNTPLMIGFGIKTKEDVRRVHEYSDGAIIGSAYIQAIQKKNEEEFIRDVLAY